MEVKLTNVGQTKQRRKFTQVELIQLTFDKKNKFDKNKIKKYIGASAIGYYEYNGNLKNENSRKGNHFLSDICFKWENEHKKIQNIPICILRIGVVLSKKGGMLSKLLLPFSLNLGSSLGAGTQKNFMDTY